MGSPTKMDAAKLIEEGYYNIFGKSGARLKFLVAHYVWVIRLVLWMEQPWFRPLPVISLID